MLSAAGCVLLPGGPSLAQWVTDPSVNTPVAVVPYDQLDVRIATDGKGGAIMVWEDLRDGSGFSSVYTQKLDAAGYPKWKVNGVAVENVTGSDQTFADIESDGKGGAFIAWQDWRSGDRDIYVQRVDSSGNMLWTGNGVAVATKAGQQQNPKIVSDGTDGAYIVWQDSTPSGWDIYAQRINGSGNILWQPGGVIVCGAAEEQINPRITSDGSAAIIVWQDKRNGVDYDIYLQRVNTTGVVQWATNGLAACAMTGAQNNPKIGSDFQGGAIAVWQDQRNGMDYNIYTQRVGSAGAMLWTTNGVAVCAATGNQSALDFTTDGKYGAVIAWKDARSGLNSDIYAQRVGIDGTVRWTNNGIPVSTAVYDQLNPNMIGDDKGNSIVVWQDASGNGFDIFAQKLDSSGMALWTAGGTPIGTAASMQAGPKHVSDGKGGAVFVWEDARKGVEFDIYAHRLLADGTTGIYDEPARTQAPIVFPNPSRGNVNVVIGHQTGENKVDMRLINVLGAEVLRAGGEAGGKITFDTGALPPGLYMVIVNDRPPVRLEIIR